MSQVYKSKVLFDRSRICSLIPIKKICVFYEFAAINVAPHYYETDELQNFHAVIATVKE